MITIDLIDYVLLSSAAGSRYKDLVPTHCCRLEYDKFHIKMGSHLITIIKQKLKQ